MAEDVVVPQPTAFAPSMATVAPLVGWIVPGGGHFLLKKWWRGLLLMTSVVSMFALGILMDGKIYQFNTGDLLDILGFLGDIGSGALYLSARVLELGRGAIHIATADYATKFLIVAGLLNIVAAVDAHHIAIGKKP